METTVEQWLSFNWQLISRGLEGAGKVWAWVFLRPQCQLSLKFLLVASRYQGHGYGQRVHPRGTLTHGLVEDQEALVEARCSVRRGGWCRESQPQTVPRGHKLPLTWGAAQRRAHLAIEPAWIHPPGSDLKGEGGRQVWGEFAAQGVTGSHHGHRLHPHLGGLRSSGAEKLFSVEPCSSSFLFHY